MTEEEFKEAFEKRLRENNREEIKLKLEYLQYLKKERAEKLFFNEEREQDDK